jgi:hypothetical protein
VAVGIGVAVGVWLGVAVGVAVGIVVGVLVGVEVGVAVGVGVGGTGPVGMVISSRAISLTSAPALELVRVMKTVMKPSAA